MTSPTGEHLPPDIEQAVRAAAEQAAASAADVDRGARLPAEALKVIRDTGLLTAVAPVELGGAGLGPAALVTVAERLARGCGATAMIWAMHQAQLACLVRHHPDAPLTRRAVADRWLIASVTSERGVGGDLGSSLAGVGGGEGGSGGTRTLEKEGTTVSYGAHADAYLITARKSADAGAGGQVAVLATRDQTELVQTGEWDTLGMRGTCSPAFRLRASFDESQVLPVPFGEIAARTMVPLSHLLWAGVWSGLAAEAVHRAVSYVREKARSGAPALVPALAAAHAKLAGIRGQVDAAVRAAAPVLHAGQEPTLGLGIELNALKVGVSENAVETARLALQVCGMAGFAEPGPHSVARILRDTYSAPLMIGNGRLLAANAQSLLLAKGER
ncbi:acyl-CoA dehydrogenase family protein [Streptomyces sp. NBC_01264]|uniref:acyl-CoA dehydrogenase family protein n=1 Tax=Streptomyces sp. NBC_01264 TaxID=2903804 RepID=UPI00225B2FB7|nr:acyl-CoA dehydrogenase family protein [Streptomyces sp. NBC_01264]MCX4778466.1 acyl-CoA/acyl-ACP dehydrogenase [Streptomyces sp. NBC_01264]